MQNFPLKTTVGAFLNWYSGNSNWATYEPAQITNCMLINNVHAQSLHAGDANGQKALDTLALHINTPIEITYHSYFGSYTLYFSINGTQYSLDAISLPWAKI